MTAACASRRRLDARMRAILVGGGVDAAGKGACYPPTASSRRDPTHHAGAHAMPSRACPFCHRTLQTLFHGRIELDRCLDCEATWFDRDELGHLAGARGAPVMTREQPVGRCPGCGGLLWSARVEGCELLACIDCAGCIVTDNQLRRVLREPRLQSGPPQLQFVCVGCKDRYAFEKAQRVTTGLACVRCAATLPRWEPPPPRMDPPAEGPPPANSGGVFTSVVDILLGLLMLP